MMRPSLWLRFYAWVTGRRVIAARCFDDETFFTAAIQTPFGGMTAYRYYGMRVGLFRCLPDGRVTGRSYITEWKAWP